MSFWVYYGHDPSCLERLASYETVVVEAQGFSDEFLERLRARIPRLLGYLSLSQYPAWKGEPPLEFEAGEKDENWGSWWIDPSNPAWRESRLKRVRDLTSRGLGIFLDNLEVPQKWSAGMVRLVEDVRATGGQAYLLANRGFELLRKVAPHIDGVLFENPCDGAFSNTQRAWVLTQGTELESLQLDAFALDYSDRYCPQASERFRRRFPEWPYFLAPNQALQELPGEG